MALRKCCVGGCKSTNATHRLFNIPKNDKVRVLWLTFLIPTNNDLKDLSKKQLVNKFVCQNHFDRYQFDRHGNRLQYGYPCLFTSNEILHKIPLTTFDGDHLIDHNYYTATTATGNTKFEAVGNQAVKQVKAVAGLSGAAYKRLRSSSSSSSDSSTSSSSLGSKRKRSPRACHKKTKRSKHSNQVMDKVLSEVVELGNSIIDKPPFNDRGSICSDISGESYNNVIEDVNFDPELSGQYLDFTFGAEIKTKEPSAPQAADRQTDAFLKMLKQSGSRYADTQKRYNLTSGFVDLETNDDVKTFDNLRHLAHSEKAYAALSYGILKQNEAIQTAICDLLSWAKNTSIDFDNFRSKIDGLFSKGSFHRISTDLLQIVCGHRAECIEMRRENITNMARDPLVKASLNKIPPTTKYLFDPEPFRLLLEKEGGVQKIFKARITEGTSQNRSKESISIPLRGRRARRLVAPSRALQNKVHETG